MRSTEQLEAGEPWPASIVMPLLSQRDEWLEQSLASALGQSVPCEVLVVTSPKTPPRNLELLDRFMASHGNLRVCCQGKDQNFAGAVNLGIRLASTRRIGLLLCDDWLKSTAVERCLSCPGDIVSTGMVIFEAQGKIQIARRALTQSDFLARPTLERKAAYLTHFFLFQREILEKVGGVDEEIGSTGADDFDMIWAMLEHDATVSIVEESLYCYRDHSDSRLTLRPREEQIRNIVRIFKKHRVPANEMPELIAEHAKWFGVSIQEALATSKQAESHNN